MTKPIDYYEEVREFCGTDEPVEVYRSFSMDEMIINNKFGEKFAASLAHMVSDLEDMDVIEVSLGIAKASSRAKPRVACYAVAVSGYRDKTEEETAEAKELEYEGSDLADAQRTLDKILKDFPELRSGENDFDGHNHYGV